jgi:PST family polysaccharide transporter
VALLGQLNSFSSISLSIASLGINSGVTKLVSEHQNIEQNIKSIINTGLIITLVCSTIVSFICLVFAKTISQKLFLTEDYYYVILIFGFTLVFYALNGLISSVVNGFKEFRLYVIIGSVASITGLLFTLFLVYFWKVSGALIAAVTYQSVIFFVSLFLVRKKLWISNIRPINYSSLFASQYFKYAAMTLTTALLNPTTSFWVRSYAIQELGINSAGIWEGINRFSSMYLSVITSVLGIYYLPQIAGLKEKKLIKNEVFSGLISTLPILLMISVLIFIFRDLIIIILFSPEFKPMKELFLNQLAGDFLKIASWMFSIIMLSKSMTTVFIISEVAITVVYISLVYLFTPMYGLQGIVLANTVHYAVYLIFSITLFFTYLNSNKEINKAPHDE